MGLSGPFIDFFVHELAVLANFISTIPQKNCYYSAPSLAAAYKSHYNHIFCWSAIPMRISHCQHLGNIQHRQDVDDDGHPELLVGTEDFEIRALKSEDVDHLSS